MRRALLATGLAMLLVACGSEGDKQGCDADGDCPAGFVCQEDSGLCRCQTDDACGDGRYCNAFGACQPRPACLGNQDCAEGEICNSNDPSGGACIPATQCGSSVHCELNSYCNPQSLTCVPGCRSTGDCVLGNICVQGSCQAGASNSDCHTCPASPTPDRTYCDYGEVCTSSGDCDEHEAGNDICSDCGGETGCGEGTTCLIDEETAAGNYCAPSCVIDSDCPSGFADCGPVSLVFDPCSSNNDCSAGASCVQRSESNQAFCECTSNDDCDIYARSEELLGVALCYDTEPRPCSQVPDCQQCVLGTCYDPQPCPGGGSDCVCFDGLTSCTENFDCACYEGHCVGTDLVCDSKFDCLVECKQLDAGDDTLGTCETKAKVCGKTSGLTCQEYSTGQAACRDL